MKRTIAEFSDTDSSGQEEQESRRSVKKPKITTKDKGKQGAAVYRMKFQSEWSKKYPFITQRSIRHTTGFLHVSAILQSHVMSIYFSCPNCLV